MPGGEGGYRTVARPRSWVAWRASLWASSCSRSARPSRREARRSKLARRIRRQARSILATI